MTSPRPSKHERNGDPLERLVARARDGETECLEQIAEQVREPLRAFLASRVPQEADADDLAHETLLRALAHLDSYDASRPFKTWLFTIGKRLAVNHVVADKRRDTRHLEAQHETDSIFIDRHELGVWERAKEALSDEAYRGLWLRYTQDASVKEVARELGRSVVSTKVLLFRARKRLLSEME